MDFPRENRRHLNARAKSFDEVSQHLFICSPEYLCENNYKRFIERHSKKKEVYMEKSKRRQKRFGKRILI